MSKNAKYGPLAPWRLGALASLPNGFGILTIPKYMIYIELARRQLFGPRARTRVTVQF
jgi:hypothetical protein